MFSDTSAFSPLSTKSLHIYLYNSYIGHKSFALHSVRLLHDLFHAKCLKRNVLLKSSC